MKLFDGNYYAVELDGLVKTKLSLLQLNSLALNKLLIIQVGDNPESTKYVSLKVHYCDKFNIPIEVLNIDSHKSNLEIQDIILRNIARLDVSGVIIQLPLPRKDLQYILNLIPRQKDLDVLSSTSRSAWLESAEHMYPPIIRAVGLFLSQVSIKEKKAILVGRGFLVGSVVEEYLKHLNYEVMIYEERDNVAKTTLDAPLVILATNVPNLIKGDKIASNSCVIDFGSSIVNGKTVGNLDLSSNLEHLALVSKSPGGMGPLVIRYLILNHLERLYL